MSLWTDQPVSGGYTEASGGWAYYVGAASPSGAYTNLTDNLDTTGLKKKTQNNGDFITYPITEPTIPSNETFLQSRVRCRMTRPASASVSLTPLRVYTTPGSGGLAGTTVTITGATTYYSGSTAATDVLTPWQTVAANRVKLGDRVKQVAAITSFLEVGVDVQTTSNPSAPTVSTTGTFTDTASPTLTWTHNDLSTFTVTSRGSGTTVGGGGSSSTTRYLTIGTHSLQVGNDVVVTIGNASYDGTWKITAVTATTIQYTASTSVLEAATAISVAEGVAWGDGSPQDWYEARVFSAAQYGAGGFDPATSAATWESGQIASPAQSITGMDALYSATYRLYVRTGKNVNGAVVFSPFAFSTFTISVPVAALSLTAVWDSTNQRTTLTFVGGGNLLAAVSSNFETAGNVGSWSALTNCTISQSTTFADTGTGSLRLSSSAAGTMSARTLSGTSGVPVVGSTAYAATARLRAGASARTCTLGITWYDSSGGTISTTTGTGVADATGSFTTVTVQGTSPSNAAFAALVVTVASTAAASELHYVDTVALHGGTVPNYTPGGLSWSLVATRTFPPDGKAVVDTGDLPSTQVLVAYDYAVPRASAGTYSATIYGSSSSVSLNSTTVTTGTVTTTSDGTYWLKAMAAPALNLGGVRVLADPQEEIEENAGEFRIDGRPDVVVVSGQMFGQDLTGLEIRTTGAAEYEAVRALVRHQGTLLLQEPYLDSAGIGLQRYIRIRSRRIVRSGTPAVPRAVFQLAAVEVGAP